MDVAAALLAAAALFLTLGALSWAAYQGLVVAFEPWTAALIVAAGWTTVSILAISTFADPRRLLRRLKEQAQDELFEEFAEREVAEHEKALAEAIAEREAAEEAVRTTAKALSHELRREAHERERQLLSEAGHRVVHAAERDLDTLVKEILGVLGAPGRVGINLLERLVAGAEPPEADAGRPRQRP